MTSHQRSPLCVALDTPDLKRAASLAKTLRGSVGWLKVGLEFISANGPDGIRAMVKTGVPVFADVKLHDIPNTVAGAARAISQLGASMINVHAVGGEGMLRAAVEAAGKGNARPKIVGVTVLTSLGQSDLAATGIIGTPLEQVVRLAKLCHECKLDGVVCSPHEIAAVREACGPNFLIVTPGVRPKGWALGDQKRVMTPGEARRAGADILVVGRPITEAPDPAAAARAIADEARETTSPRRA